jgi:hypothetical protein
MPMFALAIALLVAAFAGPCVAHRVWLIPHWPDRGCSSSISSSTLTRPARFRTWSLPRSSAATPALS